MKLLYLEEDKEAHLSYWLEPTSPGNVCISLAAWVQILAPPFQLGRHMQMMIRVEMGLGRQAAGSEEVYLGPKQD